MLSLLYGPTLTSVHDYWKTIVLTIYTFVSKVIMLSRFVIAFLYRSKHLLISLLLVTIHSDFGAQEHKMSALPIFPLLVIMK